MACQLTQARYRVALLGDSNAEKLLRVWREEFPEEKTLVKVMLFGKGGERLGKDKNGEEFLDKYLPSLLQFKPQVTFVWLGGNNLNQNVARHGYFEKHYRVVMDQYMELTNTLKEKVGGLVIEMPQFPRKCVRYGMTSKQYYYQVREFNRRFASRAKNNKNYWKKRCYNMYHVGVFAGDRSYLKDDCHLTHKYYGIIAGDLFNFFVGPNVYHD